MIVELDRDVKVSMVIDGPLPEGIDRREYSAMVEGRRVEWEHGTGFESNGRHFVPIEVQIYRKRYEVDEPENPFITEVLSEPQTVLHMSNGDRVFCSELQIRDHGDFTMPEVTEPTRGYPWRVRLGAAWNALRGDLPRYGGYGDPDDYYPDDRNAA